MCSNKTFLLLAVLYKLCVGQMEKSSLTFVIDDTGSMHDDISQVKQGVNLVFDTVMNSTASQIEDFVLVTFNDPDYRFRTRTTSRDEFKRELDKIFVDGGGDCPEMAMTGIEHALAWSRPGSYLYIFTDASARDVDKLDEVRSMAIKRNCQIVFLLTGQCSSDYNDPMYQAYHKLADATSGQVFHMVKEDVGKILKYIAESVRSRKNVITSKKLAPGYGHIIFTPVDADMKSVSISVSGQEPKIAVTSPDGSTPNTTKDVNISDVIVSRIDTVPGLYTVVVGSKSNTSVVVTATTTIQFRHGFSGIKATSIGDTATRPISGEKTYLSIKLHTPDDEKSLSVVEIMDLEENAVMELPLTLVDEKEKFYSTEAFVPPNFTFKIAIKGLDGKTKNEFRRSSLTPIEVQLPKTAFVDPVSPFANIDNGLLINAEYDEPLRISCKVRGYPKPEVVWSDNTGVTYPAPVATVEFPYDHISILEIDRVTKNATYWCNASNTFGEFSQGVDVETIPKEYFNVIEAPKDTTIEYLSNGSVVCKVDAFPPAQIKWLVGGTELHSDKYIDISTDQSVLTVKVMQPYFRSFVCKADNGRESKTFPFKIRITGFEKPTIEKLPPFVHGERGEHTEIKCRILAGSPKPNVTWYFMAGDSSLFTKLNDTNEVLNIDNLDFHHSGKYQCYVSNGAGNDLSETTLNVYYPPLIDKGLTYVMSEHGESTTLRCDVHGDPKPTVTWLRNGEKIFNDREYRIYRDRSLRFKGSPKNNGKFTCVATNLYGSARKNVLVNYVVPVAIEVPAVSKLEMKIGDHISLPCHADGNPRPTIKWVFFNSETKVSRAMRPSEHESGTLNLLNLQPHQDGYYTCVAKNYVSSTNITYQVTVLAPPIIRSNDKSAYSAVFEDVAVSIPCHAKGNPKPTITWTKNEFNIAADSEWYNIDGNGTLIIKNIDAKSAGAYVCHASNKAGVDNKIYIVKVKPFPDIRYDIPIETLYVEEGSTIALPCNVPHTRVDYVRWFKDENRIAVGNLHLLKVTPNDAGVYICRVSTFSNSTSSALKVVVGSKPTFVSDTETKIKFEEGVPAFLDCTADGQPTPEVTWTFNGQSIDFTEMLMEFDMGIETRGTYNCLVKNSYGSINRTFEIVSPDCILNLQEVFAQNQPLMVELPFLRLPLFENTNGFMRIPSNETVLLYCPSGFAKFPNTEVMAKCEGQTNFVMHKYSELSCIEEVRPQIQRTGRQCRSYNTETIKIGYEIRGHFLEVYEICLDKSKKSPVYTKTWLHRSLANVNPRDEPTWLDDGLLDLQFSEIYDCDRQVEEISSRLRKRFNSTLDNCYFNERMLVNPRDLLGGLSQKTAYTYLNVVPQWSTGSKNWDLLEQKVRDLAKQSFDDLLVWTGTSGQLKLANADAVPENINLSDSRGRQQAVPQYLWKIVQNPETYSSVAIVQLNIPNLTISEASSHMYCRDICADIPWMNGVHWKDTANGFTFCCSLKEFERGFGYSGQFGDHMNVLYGNHLPSESSS